jgi:hypothetical protein
VTNSYTYRLRTGLALQQDTGVWTNGFWYDYAKRLTNVTSQAGSFAYTLVGQASRLSKLSLPNGSYITNSHDNVARLTGTWLKNSSHSTLNSHQYTYNPGNQRTQQVFGVGSTYNYTYDAIGQLTVGDINGSVLDIDILVWAGSLWRMARKLRMEYPGAVYHVMNRGDRRSPFSGTTRIGSSSSARWERPAPKPAGRCRPFA